MSKRREKTTLAESPEAEVRLTNIRPNEVSAVDMPAIGEPFVVVKGLKDTTTPGYDSRGPRTRTKNRGDQMDMMTTDDVDRMVMKAIESRLKTAVESVKEIQAVVKSLPAKEDGASEVPGFLVDMTKSAASDIRSLQPGYAVSKRARARATSVLSIHDIAKRAEDIEKADAISYLTRDQYVSVTQNVSEYLTTYVMGVEHDDDGPMLIPANLDKTIEDSADELEKLATSNPVAEGSGSDPEMDPDEVSELSKLTTQIERLSKFLHPQNIGKAGAKMSEDRLKRLRGVSSGVSDASKTLAELIDELETKTTEDNGGEEMSEPTTAEGTETKTGKNADPTPAAPPAATPEATPAAPPTEQPATKSQPDDDGGSADTGVSTDMFKELLTKLDERFDGMEKKFDEKIDAVEETAKAAREDVKKFSLSRADSRGDAPEATTKVKDEKKTKGSFVSLLGLPSDADVKPE